MNQPQMGQPNRNQPESESQPDTSGFMLIEQLLREKVAGQGGIAEALIDSPLKTLKNAAATPRLQRQSEAVAAGIEKTRELLEILSRSEVS